MTQLFEGAGLQTGHVFTGWRFHYKHNISQLRESTMKRRWMKPSRNMIRSLLGVWLTSSDDISVSFGFLRGNRDPLHHCGLARRIYERPATCKHQMQVMDGFISAFKSRRTHCSERVLEEWLVSAVSAQHCCPLSRQPEDAHHPMLWSTPNTHITESQSNMHYFMILCISLYCMFNLASVHLSVILHFSRKRCSC